MTFLILHLARSMAMAGGTDQPFIRYFISPPIMAPSTTIAIIWSMGLSNSITTKKTGLAYQCRAWLTLNYSRQPNLNSIKGAISQPAAHRLNISSVGVFIVSVATRCALEAQPNPTASKQARPKTIPSVSTNAQYDAEERTQATVVICQPFG